MIKIRPLPDGIKPFSISYLTVTWFQSGRIRPMSGTWGSLAALPYCWAISAITGKVGLIVFAVMAFVAGYYVLNDYLLKTNQADPSEVVIDEVVGMAIMWAFLPSNDFWPILLGFILFRLFDSVKMGPVGWCDRNIKGSIGVILDDVIAGLLAGASVYALYFIFQAL